MQKYLFLILIQMCISKYLEVIKAETIKSILSNYIDKEPKELFIVYHLVFEKKYTLSSEEAKQRFENFKNNLKEIRSVNSKNLPYKFGLNQFSDLSKEEFRNKFLSKRIRSKEDYDRDFLDAKFISDDDENDLTKRNLVELSPINYSQYFGPARSQGDCAACWAFAASGVVEACLAMKKGSPVDNLSTQQLIDCDIKQLGCSGGDTISDFEYIKKNGLMKDSDYPYTASQQSCKYDSSKVVAKITETSYCSNTRKKGSCSAEVVHKMLQNGPLAVGIDGINSGLMNYSSGIFSASCSDDNHAVILVGYGKDNDIEYWLIRNSWGATWGMNGYVKVKRNDSNNFSCFVNNEAVTNTC